jgi:formylaminopyrimidine deformylase
MTGVQIEQWKMEQMVDQVHTRQDELLKLLGELVRFRTPSPPARNAAQAQQYIAGLLKDLGFKVDMWDVYPNDPNVVGVLKGVQSGGYQSLLINGHIDVAEVDEGEKWRFDPFQPHIENGRMYGRGTADMKGGLAGVLFALQLLHENGVRLPGDVVFESVVGEEVGEAGTLACCEKGYSADFGLVVDTSECHIQGQGGVITGWITVKSPQTYHDAVRRNMIHAGGGVHGASAIEKMSKIITALQELERHWAVTKSHPDFPPGTNTINPAVIEGGRHAAFVADECRLWITVHFYPDEHHEQVAKEVEDHILNVAQGDPWLKEHPPTFTWGGRSMIEDRGEIFPSLSIDRDSEAVKHLRWAHEAVFRQPVRVNMSPTVTDGGWLAEAGIPAVVYGPGDLQNAHAIDESLSVDELIRFTQVMVRFIPQWCSVKK